MGSARKVKRNQSKQNTLKAPPLHWQDQVLYWAGILLPIAYWILWGILGDWQKGREGVLAVSYRAEFLLLFPCSLNLFVFLFAAYGIGIRKPIFRFSERDYGENRQLPLLKMPKSVEKTIQLWILWLCCAVVIVSLPATLALRWCRWELGKTGISEYSSWNQTVRETPWEKIEECDMKTYLYQYGGIREGRIQVSLKSREGRNLTFDSTEFTNLDALLQLKALLKRFDCQIVIKADPAHWRQHLKWHGEIDIETKQKLEELLDLSGQG